MKQLPAGVLLALVAWSQATHAQELQTSSEVPGGSVYIVPGSNIYGNNVTLRNAFFPMGAHKSWIDYETILPAGTIEKFYIYIHNFKLDDETDIRLQIWRPTNQQHKYTLVWQRDVRVNLNHASGALYSYNLKYGDQFNTQHGDRIGWTNSGSLGAISFQYIEGHKTYFRQVGNGVYPEFGKDYVFDNIYLPSIFSVAAEINPRLNTTITATTETTSHSVTYTASISRRWTSTADSVTTLDVEPPTRSSHTGVLIGLSLVVVLIVVIVVTVIVVARYRLRKGKDTSGNSGTIRRTADVQPANSDSPFMDVSVGQTASVPGGSEMVLSVSGMPDDYILAFDIEDEYLHTTAENIRRKPEDPMSAFDIRDEYLHTLAENSPRRSDVQMSVSDIRDEYLQTIADTPPRMSEEQSQTCHLYNSGVSQHIGVYEPLRGVTAPSSSGLHGDSANIVYEKLKPGSL